MSTEDTPDLTVGGFVPESSGMVDVGANELIVPLADDAEAGALAALEQANYERALTGYTPIVEGE